MNYLDYNFGIMDTLKKAGTRALKGWDDGEKTSYGKNIALRAGEGTVIGAGTGAIAGNIAGRVKRHKAGQKAREEASKGTINKILNAINGDRLKNIEKEARKKVSLTKHTLAGMGIGAGTGAAAGASAGALETYIKRNRAKNKVRDERLLKLEEENKAERAAREKAEKDAERYKAQRGGVIPWAFRGVKKLAGKFMDWRAKKKKEWDDNHYTANDYWNDVGGGNPARFGMQHMSLTNYMTENGYHEFASKAEKIANANNLARDRTKYYKGLTKELLAEDKTSLLKSTALGSLLGAGAGALSSTLSHEKQVRVLARKLRAEDPSLKYDEAIKKARTILGSHKDELKRRTLSGALVGAGVGAVGAGASNAIKSSIGESAYKRRVLTKQPGIFKQIGNSIKIARHADPKHKYELNKAKSKYDDKWDKIAKRLAFKDAAGDFGKSLAHKLSTSKEERQAEAIKDVMLNKVLLDQASRRD